MVVVVVAGEVGGWVGGEGGGGGLWLGRRRGVGGRRAVGELVA